MIASDNSNIAPMLPGPISMESSRIFPITLQSYRTKKTMLPTSFRPMPYSVILGRGREATNAIGNRRLKILIELQLSKYLQAKSRRDKSFVVAHVLETIQEACPEGAFVKFDGRNWWEVDDNTAREKIGSMFRDRLHDHYRSSTKAKTARRRANKEKEESRHYEKPNSVKSASAIDGEPFSISAISQQTFAFFE